MNASLPGRLLTLLSLLQSRREWSGAELARRLEVTDRTVRRDVERLRALGYPVRGTTGTAGGYRMVAGRDLPPLLLDDEEAVAVATALLTAAGGTVTGIEDTSVRALAKVEQVLPARLRHRAAALSRTTVPLVRPAPNQVRPEVLSVLAVACRDNEVVTCSYRRRDGVVTERRVEPHHLVTGHQLWYLVAHDLRRDGWRTFRVDRISEVAPTGRRFRPREVPGGDPADYLRQVLVATPFPHQVVLRVAASAARVSRVLTDPLPGRVRDTEDGGCVVTLGSDTVDALVREVLAVVALGVPVTMTGSEVLRERLRALSARLSEVAGGGAASDGME
ncbi:helix-turn-helix transcriptional regulator [Actinoalloteichus spitiensis]|uniref:helix-turn-helix transcriptional regulator n=1 Tax=Actinoalloteichus spitiensis TaxID=252394 RepID=UPI00037525C7|nr:YafY family protein [Actinoalloteichus spitiensis]